MADKKENKNQVENLRFYEQFRSVPENALKSISAGRLKGMSDVNPVWRIKVMTDVFGPCGIGWKYIITKQWFETYGQEVKAFTNIDLFIKVNGEWSDAIPGTGGSTLVAIERSGSYVSDEAYKMALTDALSVAMKSLGVAADVYFSKDKPAQFDTKYEQQAYVEKEKPITQVATQQNSGAKQPSQQLSSADWNLISAEISSCLDMNTLFAVWGKYPYLQGEPKFRNEWAVQRGKVEKK